MSIKGRSRRWQSLGLAALGILVLTARTAHSLSVPLLGAKGGLLPSLSASSPNPSTASPCRSDAAGVLFSASGLLGLEASLQTVRFPRGGSTALLDTAILPIPLPIPLRAQLLSASAGDCFARTKAAHVSLDVVGLVSVTADGVQAAVAATPCSAVAHVERLSVAVLGIPVPLPDLIPANFVVPLGPVGSLVVNEESCSAVNATANALHLNLLVGLPPLGESLDVIVGHAGAGL